MIVRFLPTWSRICVAALALSASCGSGPDQRRPNVIIVFVDDLGYADLGAYGATSWETPNLDRLAGEGARFTDFYVAQPVCSASRAALLTGTYPNRIGIHGALGPQDRHGVHEDELTLGELFQSQGYATAIFGKWHLGHHPRFLPTRHGFDEFYGIPYSNDMWPNHPENPEDWGDLPTFEGERVVGLNTDQSRFTTDFTERTVDFIDRSVAAGKPFFAYLAHPMPHVPLHVSSQRRGASGAGLYADVIQEIDWSMGRILDTLQRLKVDGRTLIFFCSDNGPWLSYGDHAGSAGLLREGKGTTFEGGVRVPAIVRWPGVIPAGRTIREPAMTIDVLPTLAGRIEAPLPRHAIDGKDIWPLIVGGPAAVSPHPAYFFYYHRNALEAMRSGRWKLHFPHGYRSMEGREAGSGGIPGKYDYSRTIGLALYDLSTDIGETHDLSEEYPEVVLRLSELAQAIRAELGDSLEDVEGTGLRAPGTVEQTGSRGPRDFEISEGPRG